MLIDRCSASPQSSNYGKSWTPDQIKAEFAPTPETEQRVVEWLASSGINETQRSTSRGWISFSAPAGLLKALFEMDIYEYEDVRSGSIRLGSDQYSIPSHLSSDIDYLTPGVKLSPPMRKSKVRRADTENHGMSSGTIATSTPLPENYAAVASTPELSPDLQNCGLNITPPCIRAL